MAHRRITDPSRSPNTGKTYELHPRGATHAVFRFFIAGDIIFGVAGFSKHNVYTNSRSQSHDQQKTFTAIAVSLISVTGTAFAADGVYYRQTEQSFNLTSAPGTAQTILSLTVPAGPWVITAKANPVDFAQGDFARCTIVVGSTVHDGGATFIGGTSAFVAEIALQTVVTTSSSEVVKLQCQHDFNTSGIYLDPLASIVVVKATAPIG